MTIATNTTTAPCPDCEADLALPNDPIVGEILACDDCGAEL